MLCDPNVQFLSCRGIRPEEFHKMIEPLLRTARQGSRNYRGKIIRCDYDIKKTGGVRKQIPIEQSADVTSIKDDIARSKIPVVGNSFESLVGLRCPKVHQPVNASIDRGLKVSRRYFECMQPSSQTIWILRIQNWQIFFRGNKFWGNLIFVDCSVVNCEESHQSRLLDARKSQRGVVDRSWDVSVDTYEQSPVSKDRMPLHSWDDAIYCHPTFFQVGQKRSQVFQCSLGLSHPVYFQHVFPARRL